MLKLFRNKRLTLLLFTLILSLLAVGLIIISGPKRFPIELMVQNLCERRLELGWNTYTNKRAGYKFRYPQPIPTCDTDKRDYPLEQELENGYGKLLVISPGSPCSDNFNIYELKNEGGMMPFEFWRNSGISKENKLRCEEVPENPFILFKCYEQFNFEEEDLTNIYNIEKIYIDGREGIRVNVEKYLGIYPSVSIYIQGKEGVILKIDMDDSNLNRQIFSTLKFID